MSCACQKCVACCERRPGWFAPGEAEKAAALLGMPFEQFCDEYLVREYWVGGAYVLQPRMLRQERGFITAAWAEMFLPPSPCVFLTPEKRCRIHDAKPRECAETYACVSDRDARAGGPNLRRAIQKQWADAGDPLAPEAPSEAELLFMDEEE